MSRREAILSLQLWALFFATTGKAQNVPSAGPPQFPPQLPPEIIYEDLHLVPVFAKAHGIAMGLAFAVIFPLGAILLRVVRSKYSVWTHIAFQLLAYVLMIAGLATGIRVGKILDRPFIGFWHHHRFKKTQSTSIWTYLHIWIGRIFILLGIINGGMGLKLADNTTGGIVAYGVVAGVIGVAYIAIVALRHGKVILKEKETTPEMEQT